MSSPWTSVLGPLASAAGPVLGGLLAGPAGATIGGIVGKALASALGTPATPDAVHEAIQADPAKAEEAMKAIGLDPALVASLGAAEAVEVAREKIAAEDRQDARQQTVQLAKAGSPIAYGAPIVSTLVVIGFLGMAGALFFRQVPDSQAAFMIFGTLATGFGQVLGYWLGSSVGSKTKDAIIHQALVAEEPSPSPQGGAFDRLRPPTGRLE